ncbi:HNH endonuclease [Paenibacillus sp. PCH8]|uniref:HNH endonuclease n=1 Tax=Paenibacillus sp. PCH8 TaxID=2066524 RepID=UPI000CF848B0|nr:HNH endonuclease [Paenibacillus sp. PCH8]PQP81835.1 HNH endonuclease [Paenibacillus sp. PCH8]
MVNLKGIIDEELRMRFSAAKAAGNDYLDVISGDIHKQLGFKHRMPSCCHAMREIMRTGDIILDAPPKGNGSKLRIRYFL